VNPGGEAHRTGEQAGFGPLWGWKMSTSIATIRLRIGSSSPSHFSKTRTGHPRPLWPGRDGADHIVPVSKGGGDDRANVQIAHRGCNSRESARLTKRTAAKAAQLEAEHSITLAVKWVPIAGATRRRL
jgi:hypothetical protein